MFVIPSANALVNYIKDFTGSTNDAEIKQCIFLGELSMRNIELPALRSDPYDPQYIGVVDETGGIPIPGDMNKPILFFKQGTQYLTTTTATGTIGEYTITLAALPSRPISIGMSVSGAGIAVGATITEINSLVVTLSLPNTGAVSGEVVFATGVTNNQQQTNNGPWIVYDRIGDRDIITLGMLNQLYLQPFNVPQVIRGKFSEVGQKYKFLPTTATGDLINMYYYKAWPLLFAPVADILISATGTVGTISGAGTSLNPYLAHITAMSTTVGMEVGQTVTATAGTGSIGGGVITVYQVVSETEIIISVVGATTPTAGTITDIKITGLDTQTNPVLQTWPEGYVYSTLREYYLKRKNETDAAIYEQKFQQAVNTVEDQNNLGKWSGGHTRMTSIWQPRNYRQYTVR